jgi:hypothetical protein
MVEVASLMVRLTMIRGPPWPRVGSGDNDKWRRRGGVFKRRRDMEPGIDDKCQPELPPACTGD